MFYSALEIATLGGSASNAAALVLWPLSVVAWLAAPALTQGALVELARRVHAGESDLAIRSIVSVALRRSVTLIAASITYGLGVLVGLLLLIVPGLLLAALWCLMVPLVMLEDCTTSEAAKRSSAIVRGSTASVLVALLIAFAIASSGIVTALILRMPDYDSIWFSICFVVWSALVFPFTTYVLISIYFRRQRPA